MELEAPEKVLQCIKIESVCFTISLLANKLVSCVDNKSRTIRPFDAHYTTEFSIALFSAFPQPLQHLWEVSISVAFFQIKVDATIKSLPQRWQLAFATHLWRTLIPAELQSRVVAIRKWCNLYHSVQFLRILPNSISSVRSFHAVINWKDSIALVSIDDFRLNRSL